MIPIWILLGISIVWLLLAIWHVIREQRRQRIARMSQFEKAMLRDSMKEETWPYRSMDEYLPDRDPNFSGIRWNE